MSRPYELVVLAGSLGGLAAITEVLAHLPAGFPSAIAVVLHRTARRPFLLPAILRRHTALEVEEARDGAAIRAGIVHVAPPDRHLYVQPDRTFQLLDSGRFRFVGSAADPLLTSASEVFGPGMIAVVLTGRGSDGATGAAAVSHAGGIVIAEDVNTARAASMPAAAIATGAVDCMLPVEAIAARLVALVTQPV